MLSIRRVPTGSASTATVPYCRLVVKVRPKDWPDW